jgi:hypothetical protein
LKSALASQLVEKTAVRREEAKMNEGFMKQWIDMGEE